VNAFGSFASDSRMSCYGSYSIGCLCRCKKQLFVTIIIIIIAAVIFFVVVLRGSFDIFIVYPTKYVSFQILNSLALLFFETRCVCVCV